MGGSFRARYEAGSTTMFGGKRTLRFITHGRTTAPQGVSMSIDKTALFESTKALWPETVRVSLNPNATNDIYQMNEKTFSSDDDWR